MQPLIPERLDAELIDEESHFFKRLGEVRLSEDSALQAEAPLCTSASIRGTVLACTSTGVRSIQTAKLIAVLQKGKDGGSITATDMDSLAGASLISRHLSAVCVDDAQLFVALVYGSAVRVFGLHDLLTGKDEHCATWVAPGDQLIEQFIWGPSSAAEATGYVLTDAGHLLVGTLTSELQPWQPTDTGSGKACVAISPAGRLLALARGQQLTIHALERSDTVCIQIQSQELQSREEGTELHVTSLHWLAPSAVLITCAMSLDGAEQDQVPMMALQWSSWTPGQGSMQGLKLVEFFPLNVNPEAPFPCGSSSCLHVASIPAWGVHVVAHAKANDDHIRLIGLSPKGGAVHSLEVTGEFTAIRIPTGPDDADNFITGLALDLTSTQPRTICSFPGSSRSR
ncbi:hypothetical protein WJX73_006214 [Symbiochloris irregularis]|uniref:Uncharacterized protein n=1 Tax=Symbiochloris irregularis TaxID=706552 RepID=A0AAW1NQ64_9CHLO